MADNLPSTGNTHSSLRIQERDEQGNAVMNAGLQHGLRMLWALPLTLPGLALLMLALASGGRWHSHRGALVATGGWPGWWMRHGRLRRYSVLAITIGQVVLARDELALGRALLHELAHVRQFERWGMLFPIAYVCAGLAAMYRGGRYYHDNFFEVQARKAEVEADQPRQSC